jgi:hypothetical protein
LESFALSGLITHWKQIPSPGSFTDWKMLSFMRFHPLSIENFSTAKSRERPLLWSLIDLSDERRNNFSDPDEMFSLW